MTDRGQPTRKRGAGADYTISATRRASSAGGQRDAERTRRNLLDAAYREFSSSGFHGASIEGICKRAGVSKQMLFHHFGSKEKIYLAVLEKAYEASRSHDPEIDLSRLTPVEAIRHLVEASFDHVRNQRAFVRLLSDENNNKGRHIRQLPQLRAIYAPLIGRIQEVLDRGASEGVFRPGVDPNELYVSISALSFFYFSNLYTLQAALDLDMEDAGRQDAWREHIADFVVRAIRPDPSDDQS